MVGASSVLVSPLQIFLALRKKPPSVVEFELTLLAAFVYYRVEVWFRLHHEARNEPLPGLVRRGEEGSPGPPPPQRQHEAELGPRKSLA